jgi:hypothetical protein
MTCMKSQITEVSIKCIDIPVWSFSLPLNHMSGFRLAISDATDSSEGSEGTWRRVPTRMAKAKAYSSISACTERESGRFRSKVGAF